MRHAFARSRVLVLAMTLIAGIGAASLSLAPSAPAAALTDTAVVGIVKAADAATPLAAAAATGCNYATTGTGVYADTLCWLDFSANGAAITTAYAGATEAQDCTIAGFSGTQRRTVYRSVLGAAYGQVTGAWGSCSSSASPAPGAIDLSTLTNSGGVYYGSVTNYPISVTLPGGYVLSAKLAISGTSGNANGRAVSARTFPTWSGAFLGNNGFYSGVGGYPSLYQTVSGGRTSVTLSDIQLLSGGTRTAGFSMVVADAETTDSGESITWTHVGGTGFTWLPNTPGATTQNGTMGNACPQSYAPALGQSGATASCVSNTSSNKTGTPMLMVSPTNTTSTFSVSSDMVGSGLQGVAFGIIVARAQATVKIADRIVAADGASLDTADFGVGMTVASGTSGSASAQTGATATEATNGGLSVLVAAGGTPITFSTTASGTLASSYTASWQCTKTNPNSSTPTVWPTTGTSPVPPTPDQFAKVDAAQFLHCTVTYTPPYVTLVKNVVNGTTGATNTAADWTLTGVGTSSRASGSGTGKRTAVAVGTYALAEQGPANPWVHGYDWTGLACVSASGATSGWSLQTTAGSAQGTIASGSLVVVKGNNLTCTYTNTARPATTLTLVSAVTFGSAPATSWALSGTGPTGALTGPSGQTGTPAVTGTSVTPAVAYQLAAVGGPVTYVGTAWSCVDQNNAPVVVTGSAVTLTRGTRATCTISFATAALTLLKHVANAELRPADWTITATPASGAGLSTLNAVGAETAVAANTFEVRPAAAYTLTEALTDPASTIAYRQVALQRWNAATQTWVDVASGQITAPAAGQSAVYRFVNDRPAPIVLPLTGGASTDAFLIAGAAGLLLAAALAVWASRRRRLT